MNSLLFEELPPETQKAILNKYRYLYIDFSYFDDFVNEIERKWKRKNLKGTIHNFTTFFLTNANKSRYKEGKQIFDNTVKKWTSNAFLKKNFIQNKDRFTPVTLQIQ